MAEDATRKEKSACRRCFVRRWSASSMGKVRGGPRSSCIPLRDHFEEETCTIPQHSDRRPHAFKVRGGRLLQHALLTQMSPACASPPWLPPKNHPRCHPIRGIQARLNTSLPVQRLNDGPEVAVRTDSEFRPVGVTPTVLRFFFLPVFFDEAHLSKTRIGVARRSFARRRKQGPCRLVRARKET